MSIATTPVYEVAIRAAQPRALKLCNPQTFEREATFAAYAVTNNDELLKLSRANPGQLTEAVVQATASGVSLNPALGLAYLVPRGGKIRLEFGYQGYIQLATASGAVLDVFVELVRAGEPFRRGVKDSTPYIDHEPGDGTGDITGAYCLATLPSGRVVPCYMTRAEIDTIRKGSRSSAWNSAFAEMAKKTVIRRARKTWPRQIVALEKALAVDEIEDASVDLSGDGAAPMDADFTEAITPAVVNADQLATLREWLDATGADEEAFGRYFDVRSINDMHPANFDEACAMLRRKSERMARG